MIPRDQRGPLQAGPAIIPRKPDRDAPPAIQPQAPALQAPQGGFITTTPNQAVAVSRTKATDRYQFWWNYYRTHEESSADLKEKVTLLNVNRKFQDVHAVLLGYLTHYAKTHSEPWMYEALALAIEMNKGDDKSVRLALKYAADKAEASHNPNALVSVADMLLLHGYDYETAGKLIDEASMKVPHREVPLLLSILLARNTKDPKRMAEAVDRLLSLGWPGGDEQIRSHARKQVEQLAKALHEEGRAAEAETLLAHLTESESRDVFIRLTWLGDAGFGLAVDEPLGATARFQTPRTVFGGAVVKEGLGNDRESVYVCPRSFDGDYTIRVDCIYNNEAKPALEATLEIITHEGTPREHKETRIIPLGRTIAPMVVHLTGGRRKEVLPFVAPPTPVTVPVATKPKSNKEKGTRPSPRAADASEPPSAGRGEVKARPR